MRRCLSRTSSFSEPFSVYNRIILVAHFVDIFIVNAIKKFYLRKLAPTVELTQYSLLLINNWNETNTSYLSNKLLCSSHVSLRTLPVPSQIPPVRKQTIFTKESVLKTLLKELCRYLLPYLSLELLCFGKSPLPTLPFYAFVHVWLMPEHLQLWRVLTLPRSLVADSSSQSGKNGSRKDYSRSQRYGQQSRTSSIR